MININNPTVRLFFILLIGVGTFTFLLFGKCWASDTIKVGIFQNKPIVYFEDGPQGLFVEVLDYVAQKENWKIEYITCELRECQRLLKLNELDLMTSLGKNPERLANFTFSKEPIWTFWGTVYSNDHNIQGIFDLSGKKIGVRRGNKITSGLKELLSNFKIPVEYVEFANYETAYEAFIKKHIDAIAVNNTYGFDKQNDIRAFKTPIVFNPFSVYFVAAKNNPHADKLATIDKYVRLLHSEKSSLLHTFNQRWFSQREQGLLTAKNIGIASALLIVLTTLGMALWRHLSILKINKNLSKNIAERKQAEIALQQAHTELEKRVEERTSDLRDEIENRKILEGELAKEKSFLEAVLNNTEDGIVACSKEGVLTLFNRATRKLHGLPEKPIPAQDWADYYDLYLADGVTKMTKKDIPLFRALQGEHFRDVEMVIAPKEGEKRILLAAGQPMIDSNNLLLGAVVTMHDITERKKAELLLFNAHQELEKKVEERTMELKLSYDNLEKEIAEREKMAEALRQSQKMEAIGTLAGGIAHDFNNILGAIMGYAEMVQGDCPRGSIMRSDIDKVVEASHRAKELVKQILSFSRQTETDEKVLQPVLIVKEAIKMLRASLPATIKIQQNIDPETGLILADPTQLHQIITNLCTNAFHAMEESGGTLNITLKNKELAMANLASEPHVKPGLFVEISVGDTGPGIAPEIMDKIFNPFFTTKEVGKGTGMGLPIIHGIAKKSGGFVTCKSSVGQGTTFFVYLPVCEDTVSPETEKKPLESSQPGIERILFIDDEEMLAEMGKTMLERFGYRVTVETNSIEALKLIQNQPDRFDLVITDQTMPGITGSDLARRILQIRPELPIILCTGFSNQISEEKARLYGIKGFVMKPVTQNDLAALIRKVLDEEKGSA